MDWPDADGVRYAYIGLSTLVSGMLAWSTLAYARQIRRPREWRIQTALATGTLAVILLLAGSTTVAIQRSGSGLPVTWAAVFYWPAVTLLLSCTGLGYWHVLRHRPHNGEANPGAPLAPPAVELDDDREGNT